MPGSPGEHVVPADALIVSPLPAVVTVWSDVGCPWASLALHVLRSTIKGSGAPILIDHRAFPLELFNKRSTPKPITDAEVVAIAGMVEGLEWRQWAAPDWTFIATTLPALEAVQVAKDPAIGGLAASDQLDAELRRAFFSDHLCISVIPTILEVAERCPLVNVARLSEAMKTGRGRAAIYDQWVVAQREEVVCSPHVFAASGFAQANPGVTYRWLGEPETGFPRLETYDPAWAVQLIDEVCAASPS